MVVVPASARAFYGRREQASVVVLEGEVRYTLARALRTFVDEVLLRDGSDTFIIDLRKVQLIDSTGMGLVARVGRAMIEKRGRRAILVLGNESQVSTVLRAAAFDVVFDIVAEPPFTERVELLEVPLGGAVAGGCERPDGHTMLEAHYDLMALSDKNRLAFADVIAALECELGATAPAGPAANGATGSRKPPAT